MNGRQLTYRPPLWIAVATVLVVLILFAVVRVYVFGDRDVPLMYALPLLFVVWHRNRQLHYASILAYSALAAYQVFVVFPNGVDGVPRGLSYLLTLVNIAVVGIVTDLWVLTQNRVVDSHQKLQLANSELQSRNGLLAAQEKEVNAQNELLRLQASELQQKMIESQRLAEQLEQQTRELKQVHHELDDRIKQAEEAFRRKTRFLSAVSHDIRTPANAICLMAEVIKQAGESPELFQEVPRMADSLKSNAKLLVEFVSDVLDLSRFDYNTIEIEASDINVGDVIRSEVGQFQPMAISAGVQLKADLPNPSIWIRTDQMKLARVLDNLISNAVKYTPAGQIQIACAETAGGLEIRVQDSGVGIQEDQLPHLFDEFYQINNPNRDRSNGTGLGLAICKRLLDAMGCKFRVESRIGKGSTFAIQIPPQMLIKVSSEEPRAASTNSAEHRLEGLRALVVEDHDTTRAAVSMLLSAQGANVDQAPDGRSALRLLNHQMPDVLLLDMVLPDMDGREVLAHLSENRPPTLRCLLVVTGDLTEARRKEVLYLGADGIVPKPVHLDSLIDRICEELGKGGDEHLLVAS